MSTTFPGKVNDKKIADKESISYPRSTTLYKDTGFQSYEPTMVKAHQPKKATKKRIN